MLRIPVGPATNPARNSTRSPRASASIREQREFHAPLDGFDRIATRRTMVDLTSALRRGNPNRSEDESFDNNEEGHPQPIFLCVVK